tara:strand:- start:5493 stop:6116 length:624 start_codon:yes stop_codon:yes gene_type:complete
MSTLPDSPDILSDPMGWLRERSERIAGESGKDKFGRQKSPGLINDILGTISGATPEGTKEYADAAESYSNEQQYKDVLEELGGPGAYVPGLSKGDYQNKIYELTRDRTNTDFDKSPQGKALAHNMGIATEQLTQQGKRLDQNYNLQLMQMRNATDARLAELEYQKMRDRKEDMQYNERMAKLDRKDRILAMQNIAAGLASLGAAFAF